MKRLFSFLLAMAMIFCLLPVSTIQAAEITEGDGTASNAPVFIDSEEEWVYYLNNSTGFAYKHTTQMTWYFKLTADIVLDAAEGEDTVNGATGYTSTGKTTVIDFDGHTVSANGGTARFMAAANADSDLTLKNGTVIMNRSTNQNGSIFYVYKGGKLTLDNMKIVDEGTGAHSKNGELLYSDGYTTGVTSAVTLINTGFSGELASANPVYIKKTALTVTGGNIAARVNIADTASSVAVSSAAKISDLDVSAGALVDVSGLTEGAQVRVTAGESAFTAAMDNASAYLPYVKSADVTKKVAVVDDALALVAEEIGDGTAEKPWLITSEADYVEHIMTNTSESGFYKLKADVVLDSAKDDDVNGNQNGSATGRSIYIDLNGYTISAIGSGYRFFSCGADGDLTMKNGTVIVNRTYNNSFGAVFNILNGGKLTLENMYVSEVGTAAFSKDGELLSVTAGSSATVINTVMEADTTNNTSEKTVDVANSDVTFINSEIRENVYVTAKSNVTVSGATKIESLDLTSGALLNVGALEEGAMIAVNAETNKAFTNTITNAEAYAGFFTTGVENMVVGVLEGALAIVAKGDGTGETASDPIFINSNEEWIEYLEYEKGIVNSSQQQDWYFVMMADVRIRTGANTYGATGKNITIDFNGHSMNSANGTSARYMRVHDGSLTMRNGTLEENGVSTSHGAVFYLERATLVLENMKVDEYSATAYKKRGEIIYATASEITLRNTQITGIFTGAVTDYGAIYLREETATGAPSVLNIISSSLSCTETGEVEKGGWITAGKNTFVNMVDSHISGGAAQLGGNVYIGGSAKMTMTESTITGGTATAGGDLYLLGSVQVDAQSQIGDGSFYAGEKADLDAAVGAMVADIATGNAVWYRNITDAVAAYTAGCYMKMFEAAELALATDAVIDINGLNVAVAGQGETKITAYDTANKDYATFGSLRLEGAVLVNDVVYETANGTNYYTLSQDSGYSFHVLDMGITGVALRTTTGGIYFKGVWNCDETLKAQIASFGVAVSLRGMPGTDFAQSEDCLYTAFAGEDLVCGAEMTGVMIDGIVKKDREPALNDGYGRNYAVCATAYVTFKSGETVVSDDAATEADDVAVTLYSVVNGIESLITELEATNVEENKLLAAKYLQLMDAFYVDWKDYGLESWGREDFTEPGN